MRKKEKFVNFLDLLKNNSNDKLLETIKNGFISCLEGMNKSPIALKEEMKNYLKTKFKGLVDFEHDKEAVDYNMEAAIYWFANDYHSGQFSDLYSLLSTSDYKLGPNSTLKSENEEVSMFYNALEEKFINF